MAKAKTNVETKKISYCGTNIIFTEHVKTIIKSSFFKGERLEVFTSFTGPADGTSNLAVGVVWDIMEFKKINNEMAEAMFEEIASFFGMGKTEKNKKIMVPQVLNLKSLQEAETYHKMAVNILSKY